LPVIDVRSPGEFEQGHIPGAFNIPLFSNEERAHVGTVYKQNSQEAAIALGYKYVTPKLDWFLTESRKVAPDGNVVVHCWRGGMRSQAFAQHLSENGFLNVRRIIGGYKAYRNFVLESLGTPLKLKVLGGYTGSGKTHILQEIQKQGFQVLDLEGIAHHKGSAFGGIGQLTQPTVEQFENNLYFELRKLDTSKTIWVEDESYTIGAVKIPAPFFEQMRSAIVYFIDIPREERIALLVEEYAVCEKQKLADAIHRIAKRLGGQNEQLAVRLLDEGNYAEVARIALHYYDKSYLKGLAERDQNRVITLTIPTINYKENAKRILGMNYANDL
jgi:tRNA 2-selenouridine synthase